MDLRAYRRIAHLAPRLAIAIPLALASACSGDEGAGGEEGASYTITWGPVQVASGEEDTRCVTKRIDNPAQIRVGRIHNELQSSHHLIVYRVADEVERPDPYPCQPFSDTLDPEKGAPLMVSQRSEDTLELPESVAF